MQTYDVIIVGAGFAGISAARELYRANINVLVLEARDRLGGRVQTEKVLDNISIDSGGQWIGPTQDNMYNLVEEYGHETYRTYNSGKCVLDLEGKISTYTGLIPKIDPLSLWSLDQCIKKLDRMAASISVESPWLHPKAKEWDSMTLAGFLSKNVKKKKARILLKTGLETVLACSPTEISLLHVLFYIKSGKDINTLLEIDNGAQQDRIVGGMQGIVESMAKEFKDKIYFEEIVQRIEQLDEQVIVYTQNCCHRSKKVIITTPPVLSAQINYQPPLSLTKRQLLQKVPMGIVVKCYAIYKTPFWRKKGFSGEAVTDENSPFQTIFDNGSIDADYGILMGFALAQRATSLMRKSLPERKSLMISTLSKYFGDEANEILHYQDKCWAEEEFSQGCYVGYFPPGVWTQYEDEIRRPEGHIHWAGTETATEWNGYIEGAVRSGLRASAEVMSLL